MYSVQTIQYNIKVWIYTKLD